MDYPVLLVVNGDNTVTGMLLLDESCMGCLSTKPGETAYRYHSPVEIGAALPADAVKA